MNTANIVCVCIPSHKLQTPRTDRQTRKRTYCNSEGTPEIRVLARNVNMETDIIIIIIRAFVERLISR